ASSSSSELRRTNWPKMGQLRRRLPRTLHKKRPPRAWTASNGGSVLDRELTQRPESETPTPPGAVCQRSCLYRKRHFSARQKGNSVQDKKVIEPNKKKASAGGQRPGSLMMTTRDDAEGRCQSTLDFQEEGTLEEVRHA